MTDSGSFPDLLPAFPHTAEFIVNGRPTMHDVDFQPSCGYVSIDEARILWQAARDFPGTWCEIGSHTGFSGAHIAHGLDDHGVGDGALVAIEPQYVYLDFFRRARANWHRADVDHLIFPIAALSGSYFDGCRETFTGAFVDGDHEPGKPQEDAATLLPRMAGRCVIVLHDGVGQPVLDAADWLAEQGFTVRIYDTMARLVVCWRGDWEPPEL